MYFIYWKNETRQHMFHDKMSIEWKKDLVMQIFYIGAFIFYEIYLMYFTPYDEMPEFLFLSWIELNLFGCFCYIVSISLENYIYILPYTYHSMQCGLLWIFSTYILQKNTEGSLPIFIFYIISVIRLNYDYRNLILKKSDFTCVKKMEDS
jgi:hypothetical protein